MNFTCSLNLGIVYPSMVFYVELSCIPFKECNVVAESLSRATNSQLLTKWEHMLTCLYW